MITLTLQLVFESKPKMTHQEMTNYIIEHFPGDDIIAVASGPTEDGEVRLKLKQDQLTDEQRDWLHLDDIARYIDRYVATEPQKPITLEYIRGRIRSLRHMRDTVLDKEQIELAEEKLRSDLYPDLYVTWVKEMQDYGLFLNQGEPRQQYG